MYDPIEDVEPVAYEEPDEDGDVPPYVLWVVEIGEAVRQLQDIGWRCDKVTTKDEDGQPYRVQVILSRDRGTGPDII